MSVYDDILADQDVIWFDTDGLAKTVIYGGQSISAFIVYDEGWTEGTDDVSDTLMLIVKSEDVPEPEYRDVVQVTMPGGAENWYVRKWTQGNQLAWFISLYREERPKT